MSANRVQTSWRFNFIAAAYVTATLVTGCGGGGGGGSGNNTPPPATYSVGGTVQGLTASGLVLQDNGADNLTIAANSTTFKFPTMITSGAPYAVTVLTQPTGQTCTLGSGSGTASTNVTSVAVTCTANTYLVTGSITGLTGTGLVLQNNGGGNLTVAANATTFTFPAALATGAAYSITVLTQPASPPLNCTVNNGSGTIAVADVTNVQVACVPATFSVGGTITGLTSAGLVITNNGGDSMTVPANATTFTFATSELTGAAYAVTVNTQPGSPREYCSVANAGGTIVATNISTVAINCHAFGRFLYVANSIDGPGSNGDVSAFAISSTNGTLTPVTTAAYGADVKPSGIVVDPTGQFAYVSNRTSADVSMYTIDQSSGALTLQGQAKSKNTFSTSVTMSPSGNYLFVAGSGQNSTSSLFGFTVNATTGLLTADTDSPYVASNLPFGLAVDPSNTFLFATAEQLHGLHSYEIGTSPLLTETANSPANTPSQPYGVVVSPNANATGGFVFVSDQGLNRVSSFSYDSTGTLTELTNKGSPWPTGLQPQGLALDPTGSYLYVANYGDGTVSSFSVGSNGALTPIQVDNNAVNTGNLTGVPNPGPTDVKVDPAAPFLYVVNGLDGSVSLFSTAQGVLTLVATYPAGDGAAAVAID
jgi:6-phosphogluconolactonase (cycloisomerase 2 family)